MLLQVAFILSIATAPLLATNTTGEPTDINNWPPCAQECIPRGFGPPADCGNLSNITCICQQRQFTAQLGFCELLGCSSQETQDIRVLSNRLCEPVGGFGTSLLATISAFATSQPSLSTTPTVPAGITGATKVSSVLATATTAPDLGNPANLLSYPLCAQICNNETIVIGQVIGAPYGDTANLEVACGPAFRGATAGCEAATCSPGEYTRTQLLAEQLCGSSYSRNATLSSAVSSAVASATSAAQAATEGKDPIDLANFPPCGQKCIPQNNYNGCGSGTNLECICQGIPFNKGINACELSSCSMADLQTIVYLSEKLCEPVLGILTHPVNGSLSDVTSNVTSNTTHSTASPVPFTGEAMKAQNNWMGFSVVVIAIGLGLLMH